MVPNTRRVRIVFGAIRYGLAPGILVAIAFLALRGSDSARTDQDRLWQHRNLGKAFYENKTTSQQAVEEFRKALEMTPDSPRERLNYGLALLRAGKISEGVTEVEKVQKQDPAIPHTWFVLGLQYKKAGEYDRALEQFERMIQLVPNEALAHFQLGLLYSQTGQTDKALKELKEASRLDPSLAAPHYQMFNIHRDAERPQEAERAVTEFLRIKKSRPDSEGSEDLEASYYSEILEDIDPKSAADEAGQPADLKFRERKLAGKVEPASAGLVTLDADGDGRPDLLAWSAGGVLLYKSGTDLVDSGLSGLKDVHFLAPEDFNNDGLADLCALSAEGPALYVNKTGRFEKLPAKLPSGRFLQAVWLDYDHDYDADLILLGEKSFLFRNQGDAGWADQTSSFPFVAGRAIAGAAFRLVADTKAMDLAVSYEDQTGVLYRDRLLGVYEAVRLEGLDKGTNLIVPSDADNDGAIDLAYSAPSGVKLLLNKRDGFRQAESGVASTQSFVLTSLDNRTVPDLVAGDRVFRGKGLVQFKEPAPAGLADAILWASADFDLDGKIDLAAITTDGALHLLTNATEAPGAWLGIRLVGVKTPKLAPGAEVEVKAGSSYQKKIYDGLPLVFGLPGRKMIDTVRITWPNGMIQNETKQAVNQFVTYKEAPKLSGSCPMIFTWNGSEFEFITDVLGVAPLGASSGSGEFFPVDHDEYVQISGKSLAPVNGRYEIRITEELSEVSYLDQVTLIAVDHPEEVEIFTNDKWKGPPFSEFRLFGVNKRIYPVSARDNRGRDVLARIVRRDSAYPDGFRRDYAGIAEEHALELDFGDAAHDNRAVLVLNGWVDWADGSAFLSAAQQRKDGLVPPYLQVRDGAGRWRTVLEDMGMPSGKAKTIAVDLTGRFLSRSREVRIVTSMCVYWDEIFLGEDTTAPQARLTRMDAASAGVHFRGFSRVRVHPQRKQPEYFEYAHVRPVSSWNPTPGMYTRYGDVRKLVLEPDDRMVIMGSGDELRLSFDATSLPPLPRGWRRDFLLLVDGWAKDRDANTAFSQTVEPLPFHRMSSYPYPATERYPDDPAHVEYRREYNTRPALRLIRPLISGGSSCPSCGG